MKAEAEVSEPGSASTEQLRVMDAYWRAANYLTIGQIYLQENPLLREALRPTLDACFSRIRSIQKEARDKGFAKRPEWPAIVLRTPKGWTGPKVVDGLPIEGTFRAHQVPLANVRSNPDHLRMLEQWMRST
jgi:xylulose-5-phosphate/fructose-6-phosphate phosphoketolase